MSGCYAGEQEFLFQPHSFLEPLGGEAIEVTADGVIGKVHYTWALHASFLPRNSVSRVIYGRVFSRLSLILTGR